MKRLLYLILQDPERYHSEVSEVFNEREKTLFKSTDDVIKIADLLIKNEEHKLVEKLLTYFSENELKNGLYLTMLLAESIEKRFRILPKPDHKKINKLDQIW